MLHVGYKLDVLDDVRAAHCLYTDLDRVLAKALVISNRCGQASPDNFIAAAYDATCGLEKPYAENSTAVQFIGPREGSWLRQTELKFGFADKVAVDSELAILRANFRQ